MSEQSCSIHGASDEACNCSADEISFSPTGTNPATDVQQAIENATGEGVASFNGRTGVVAPAQADYDAFFLTPAEGNAAYAPIAEPVAAAHIADGTDAHAGTAITNTPAGTVAATTVQAAINELDAEKLDAAAAFAFYQSQTGFDDHSARHENGGADEISLAGLSGLAAADVVNTPAGTIAATTVQGAINELDSEKTTAAAAAAAGDAAYVPKSLLDAKGDLIAASADNTPSKLTVGANDTLLVAASGQASGLQWRVLADGDIPAAIARDSEVAAGYTPRASVATYADRKNRTAGNLTLNSTTWANVETGLDIVLSAATGDWIEVGVSALGGGETVMLALDVVSLVSGSPVNSWADDAAPDNTHDGVMAWYFNNSAVNNKAGGSILRKLVAGDISAGTVTLRLRYRTGTAANKTFFATAGNPLTFWARNHG